MPMMIEFDGCVIEHGNCSRMEREMKNHMQWYVLYTEWGQVKRKCFKDDEFAAKRFAETEENAQVCYGFC